MSNKNIIITVILAFAAFGAFTQVDSAFADAHNCNEVFIGTGCLGTLGVIAMFIFGRNPSA